MAGKSREFGGKRQKDMGERDRTDKDSGRPIQLEPDKERMDRPGQKPGGGQHEGGQPGREQQGGQHEAEEQPV